MFVLAEALAQLADTKQQNKQEREREREKKKKKCRICNLWLSRCVAERGRA